VHPRAFEFSAVATVGEAVEALAVDGDARLIAGGQSLLPLLSGGAPAPSRVIDINRVELAGIKRVNGRVVVGALTRHRELERSARAAELLPLMAQAVRHVGNPAVRNRGTFGGSLSHADPSAELCAAAVAYGGEVVLAGPDDERSVPIEDFLVGSYETSARQEEVLVRAELDAPPEGSGTGFAETARRTDDFAFAGAAAVVTLGASGETCEEVRLAVLGAGGPPVRVTEAEAICRGERPGPSLLDAVAGVVPSVLTAGDSAFVSAAHRRRCAAACARRALAEAIDRARGPAA
jgi:aerobic carbon-monoxide dehydrogenase medium subunit